MGLPDWVWRIVNERQRTLFSRTEPTPDGPERTGYVSRYRIVNDSATETVTTLIEVQHALATP